MSEFKGYCTTCGARISLSETNCGLCENITNARALVNGIVIINYKPVGRIIDLKDEALSSTLFYGTLDNWPGWTTEVYSTKCQVLSDLIDAAENSIIEVPKEVEELPSEEATENGEDKS